MMTFDEYQTKAAATALYPKEHSVVYPTLGLTGEAGEFAEKVKKILRDGNPGDIANIKGEKLRDLIKELGDVLWYVAAICSDLDISMELVAYRNIQKLADRQSRGVVRGSGDNR